MINLTRLSPSFLFFVCTRGEPGNEASIIALIWYLHILQGALMVRIYRMLLQTQGGTYELDTIWGLLLAHQNSPTIKVLVKGSVIMNYRVHIYLLVICINPRRACTTRVTVVVLCVCVCVCVHFLYSAFSRF